jgi:pyruvate formate lyase activating enzyme
VTIDDSAGAGPRFDRSRCDRCTTFECAAACLSQALRVSGTEVTVGELLRTLRRDSAFWGDGGGVTFGGGEPFRQRQFLLEALRQCRESFLHTAVETSAHVDPDVLLESLRWLDWLFVDLKHMDPETHRAGTGVDNALIRANIERIASSGWQGRVVVRVPVVPGFNDDATNLDSTARFVRDVGLEEVHLLPFHRLGASKYAQLGLEYRYSQTPSPSHELMEAHAAVFEAAGLRCWIDVDTPF